MSASNQNLFTDTDIIRIATEELQSVIVPYIESVKQEYFVTTKDVAFDPNQLSYVIPQRATGNKLRDVSLITPQGSITNLPYVAPELLKSTWAYTPLPFGYYPKDTKIVLLLSTILGTASYSSVRMDYFRRPNVLCRTSDAGMIVAINRSSGEVTLNSAPTTWTTSTLFDSINGSPPFQSKGDDLAITDISGFILTFVSIPSDLVVGDYISEANTSPIAQVPVECHRLLEALTAARMLQYMGDPGYVAAQQQAQAQKNDLIQVLSPRVDGAPAKIPIRSRLWFY